MPSRTGRQGAENVKGSGARRDVRARVRARERGSLSATARSFVSRGRMARVGKADDGSPSGPAAEHGTPIAALPAGPA